MLALAYHGWEPRPKEPLLLWDWDRVLFVDAAQMVGYFCFALFGPSIEARFGWFGDMVLSQQVAELAGLIKGTRIAINRRWDT